MEYGGFRYELTKALHTGELGRLQPVPKQGKVVRDRFFAAVRASGVIDALCRDGDRSHGGRRAQPCETLVMAPLRPPRVRRAFPCHSSHRATSSGQARVLQT